MSFPAPGAPIPSLLLVFLAAGCGLPDRDLSACRTTADCLDGDSCVEGLCVSPQENQKPSVTIIAPRSGTLLAPGLVIVEAAASDPDGSVSRVEFELPGGTVNDEAPPFQATWDASGAADGASVNLAATAWDDFGARSEESVVEVTVQRSGCIGMRTYASVAVPVTLPPATDEVPWTTTPIQVPDGGAIQQLRVSLTIRHSNMFNLGASLRSPSGTTHLVFSLFSYEQEDLILEDTVTAFDGETATGVWELDLPVADTAPGTLEEFSLSMELCVP